MKFFYIFGFIIFYTSLIFANHNKTDGNLSLQADANLSVVGDDNLTEINKTAKPPLIEISKYKEFQNTIFKMPSDAVAIDSIVIKYIDNNGKIQHKYIDINKSIDWNDDFAIQKRQKLSSSKTLDVSVTSTDPNLNKLKSQTELNTTQTTIIAPKIELPLISLKYDEGLKFAIKNNSVKIITQDELKYKYLGFNSKIFKAEFFRDDIPLSFVGYFVNKGGFNDINITKNSGYYSICISVNDGNYTMKKASGGYTISKN